MQPDIIHVNIETLLSFEMSIFSHLLFFRSLLYLEARVKA